MDRFSHRDNVLLVGYNQRSSFSTASSSSSPKAPFRNSDDDFRDVFGGPPRRFSMQDTRHSFGHFNGTVALGFRGGDETISSSRPWSEKPVFGEEGGGDQTRYTSDDFFDDIFRGGDSESSTPRKIDKDLYSSSPGSRVLSPARPLPARAEPFGGSSQLAQFSLPAKLNKGTELLTFASPNHSPSNKNKDNVPNGINLPCSLSASMSRFSSQTIQVQDESRNDARPSYRQSPLSVEFSLKSDGSVQVNKSETDTIGKTKKDSNCSDVPTNSNQFHFSIYKWASKGVPLLMPLRSGKGSNLKEKYIQRCSSSSGRIEGDKLVAEVPTETLFDMELPSSNESASLNTEACRIECVKQDTESLHNSGTQDKMESSQSVTKAVLVVPELKSLDSLQHTVKDSPDKTVLLNKVEELKPHPLSETGIYGKKEEKTEFVEEGHKPELKPLHSLLSENDDGQGDVEVSRVATGKESTTRRLSGRFTVGRNIKTDGKRTVYNGTEVDRSTFQGSPVHMGDNVDRNKIKGTVKEFVKIFNKEAPLKPINNAGIQSPSFRWKEATFKAEKEVCAGKDRADETLKEATFKAEKEVCAGKDTADETLRVPTTDKTKISPNISVMVEEYSKESQEPDSGIDTASHIFSSTEQKDSSFSSDGSKTTTQSVDDFFQGGFCNFFVVKELSQDQNKVPQAGEDQQDFQDSDAKIKQWSAGKEGNIRSLLSTLQYILWPDSGWRPVPLVDIIEGNAVKRAYQKALLCLHPDKLQQKGVAAHQKYAAEKVFDILQEAWDHFNSVGSL